MAEASASIPFQDLTLLHSRLQTDVEAAALRVMRSGSYILGPEVAAFEEALADYHRVRHAVAVGSGTDAIELCLRGSGIGLGDEVITASHTAVATVCAIERAGSTPVLVEIDPAFYTIDPQAVMAAITPRTRAIVAVHLYGHPAEMDTLSAVAARSGLLLIEDCAQAQGARHHDRPVGSIGHLAALSFYPTKTLGAYGDGGAILTSDDDLAARIRRLRVYGESSRGHSSERGQNSRLDELQAAILRVKLVHLDALNDERRRLAHTYLAQLRSVALPIEVEAARHVYHLFVIRHDRRDQLRQILRGRGVETLVHYPIPVHLQPAYAHLGCTAGSLPVTESTAGSVLSLPLYCGLDPATVEKVAAIVNELAPTLI